MTRGAAELRPNWLIAIRRYLVAIAVGNLLWETAQIPLYTRWRTGTPGAIVEAVLHGTAGDLLIGTITLAVALAAVGVNGGLMWGMDLFGILVLVLVLLGIAALAKYLFFTDRGGDDSP